MSAFAEPLAQVREALKKRQRGTGSTKNIEPALAALDLIEQRATEMERKLASADYPGSAPMSDSAAARLNWLEIRVEEAEQRAAELEADRDAWKRAAKAYASDVERLRIDVSELRRR